MTAKKLNRKPKKSTLWNMRTNEIELSQISQLAERLKVNKSEAVRRAVVYVLATLPNKLTA
jgi:hypothetical protein